MPPDDLALSPLNAGGHFFNFLFLIFVPAVYQVVPKVTGPGGTSWGQQGDNYETASTL